METPVRIQRSRITKQVSPNGLPIVYVGRPGKWGNPFRVEQMGKEIWRVKTGNPDLFDIILRHYYFEYETKQEAVDVAVECFRIYIKNTLVDELKGKNLSCWCSLKCKCHADVLLKLANP